MELLSEQEVRKIRTKKRVPMAVLGKREFVKMLATRLKDPDLSTKEFIELSKIYKEMKRWTRSPKQKTVKLVESATPEIEPTAEPEELKVPESVKELTGNDLILQLEEERKHGSRQ